MNPTYRLIEINSANYQGYFLNLQFTGNPEAFQFNNFSFSQASNGDFELKINLDLIPTRVDNLDTNLTTSFNFLLPNIPYGPDEEDNIIVTIRDESNTLLNSVQHASGGNVLTQAGAEGDSMPFP